jgi:hydroxyacylglutathione hydrolase
VIDTHIHADHVSGARRLISSHDATLCLHHSAATTYPYHPLHDGDELELGQLRLRIWHTPGHRPELISILVADLERCLPPPLVLTGDSLLVGDVGRPDFAGGDAAAQYQSITRLLGLPDWVEVFPGHFEGPCGNDMWGRASTTIGFERLYNPLTRLDRERFMTVLSSSVPARPLNMCAIEATKRSLSKSWPHTWSAAAPIPHRVLPVQSSSMCASQRSMRKDMWRERSIWRRRSWLHIWTKYLVTGRCSSYARRASGRGAQPNSFSKWASWVRLP